MNLFYMSIPRAREITRRLILSEFAGAAQSLEGALIVNPWNTESRMLFMMLLMSDEA
jgi:trehalose-6-phosphate synthase